MILKNYINKDIYRTSGAILLLLILIFISSRFVKYIQLAVDGTISAKAVFSLLALQIPAIAGFLIPLSFFLAILLNFGRLYSDNELVVIHSCGTGERDLAKMLMPLAGWFAITSAFLSLFLTPWAISQSKTLLAEQAAQAKLGVFSAGRFKETANRGIVFVDHKREDGSIKGIFSVSREEIKIISKASNAVLISEDLINDISTTEIAKNESGDIDFSNQEDFKVKTVLKIQTAESGQQWTDEDTKLDYLLLQNGQFSEYDPSKKNWQKTEFKSSYTRIAQDTDLTVSSNIKAKSTYFLLQNLQADSILSNKSWAALHWRLAAPLSIPLICLLAIPLSRTQPRKGKFSRIFPSIMIYLIYVLLMMYSRKLIESGKLNEVLGFWWIHGGLAFAIYLLYRSSKSIIVLSKAGSVNV